MRKIGGYSILQISDPRIRDSETDPRIKIKYCIRQNLYPRNCRISKCFGYLTQGFGNPKKRVRVNYQTWGSITKKLFSHILCQNLVSFLNLPHPPSPPNFRLISVFQFRPDFKKLPDLKNQPKKSDPTKNFSTRTSLTITKQSFNCFRTF